MEPEIKLARDEFTTERRRLDGHPEAVRLHRLKNAPMGPIGSSPLDHALPAEITGFDSDGGYGHILLEVRVPYSGNVIAIGRKLRVFFEPLAGNQPSTEVSSTPDASPALKTIKDSSHE